MYPTNSSSTLLAKVRGFFFLFLFAMVGFSASVAHAQLAGEGEIKGTVKDPSGAVVAGATVTATDPTTGQKFTRTTNTNGDYDISPVDPGIYSVTTVASGFEKLTQTNVHVNAMEVVNYNPVMTVGSTNETVTVTSSPAALGVTGFWLKAHAPPAGNPTQESVTG